MMLRVQHERRTAGDQVSLDEYVNDFCLTEERANRLPVDTIVMHPGPMNRGVEIASAVADSDRSVVLEQVRNGVSVRMAVLFEVWGDRS
jgi:aspartate carbamoyltransferase catalytic subunit